MALTNSREAAAFFVARAIVLAIYFVVTPMLLAPIYAALLRAGGPTFVMLGTTGVTFVMWLVTLLLFLTLRGGFGGVPMAAGQGRRNAVTTSAGEIGAFFISVLIVMVVVSAFVAYALVGLYVSLRLSGQITWGVPISMGVSALSAVVFFLLFIAIRGAMPGAPQTGGPVEAYDDSMNCGRAVAACFRKYAVFSGRASRSEYWFFVLFQFLILTPLIILDFIAFRGTAYVSSTLALLIMFLPNLAVTVRRLHDIDMGGWWVLLTLIPLVGVILVIVWGCHRGTDGANRFGMGPANTAIPEVFA